MKCSGFRMSTIVASIAMLAGCAQNPVLEQRLGQVLPANASASYDAGSDTVTLSKGGSSMVLPKTGNYGTTSLFQNGGTTSSALYTATSGGAGRVFVFASEDSDLGIVGAIASRDAEVTLPASGSASFNGGYVGLFVRASDKNVTSEIAGTACLTAIFGAAPSIGGAIVNRPFGLADIVIPTTPLSAGGVFSGTVTGGEAPGETTSNGQVAGMFADVGAGEIVGVLKLDHTAGGQDYYEVGGFTTVAGPCI